MDERIYEIAINDGHAIQRYRAVEYEGAIWLALAWIANDRERWQAPTILVGLENHQVRDHRTMVGVPDFSIPSPVPKAEIEALSRGEPVAGYRVVRSPPLRFPLETRH